MRDLMDALSTVVAVSVTPFDEHGHVDDVGVDTVVRHMLDAGVSVITPNGNTGEFYSLTVAEAQRVVERVVESVVGRAIVLPGVGYAAPVAAQMARSAAAAGAPAVMVHQPVHPYSSDRGWLEYHRAIAEEIPETGIVPYLRHAQLSPDTLAELADTCPNVVGVKYAVPDVLALSRAVASVPTGRLAWICGLAESWAPFFWPAGARGFTSGLVNIAPRLSLGMLRALQDGDQGHAMTLWRATAGMEDLRARNGQALNVSAIKEALHQRGWCRRNVRPPISELSETERAEVAAILENWADQASRR